MATITLGHFTIPSEKIITSHRHVHSFIDCIGYEISDDMVLGPAWPQQWWSRVALTVLSVFIASFCSSGIYDTDDIHLTNALDHFNLLQLRNLL